MEHGALGWSRIGPVQKARWLVHPTRDLPAIAEPGGGCQPQPNAAHLSVPGVGGKGTSRTLDAGPFERLSKRKVMSSFPMRVFYFLLAFDA